MKKIVLCMAVAIVATSAFAQKANVRKAKNLALSEEAPDYNGARKAIEEAIQNEETKNLTETWYVAGLIGYQQNANELLKLQLGKGGKDYVLRGQAVMESLDYWKVADSISQIPVIDKKGRAKVDTRTRKNISERVLEYFTHQELIQYAVEMNEKQNFSEAYRAFSEYVSIPNLPMMQDPKLQEKMPRDTNYYTYKYYAGRMAYSAGMKKEAMNIFAEMMYGSIEAVTSAEFLYQCYIDMGDSIAANDVLDKGIQLFPSEAWFFQNRINNLVNAGKMNEAIECIDKAIANDPQIQYFVSKGSILNLLKRPEEAIATYEQALRIEPQNATVYENYGFVYTDIANRINDDAAYLSGAEYKAAKEQSDDYFKKALPYFEKAYQLAPDNNEYKRSLRMLYYRLGMQDKYDELAN